MSILEHIRFPEIKKKENGKLPLNFFRRHLEKKRMKKETTSNGEKEAQILKARKAYEQMSGQLFSKDARQSQQGFKYWDSITRKLEQKHLPIPDVEKLKLLDLGGGSDGEKHSSTRVVIDGREKNLDLDIYRPYFPRFMAALGAKTVVNVDVGPKSEKINDVMSHVQTFMTNDKDYSLVEVLKQHGIQTKFNVIFSSMVIDNIAPEILDVLSPDVLKTRIMAWAEELLDEGGYLLFDYGSEGYMLKNGRLIAL